MGLSCEYQNLQSHCPAWGLPDPRFSVPGFCCAFAALVLVLVPAGASGQGVYIQRPRAVVINFDPILESASGQRVHAKYGWSPAVPLATSYVGDLAASSHGLVNTRITRSLDADVWPVKADGFRYDDATFRQCWEVNRGDCHSPDGVD